MTERPKRSGNLRLAREIREAVKIIGGSFNPSLNDWPEEEINSIPHDNQRERLIGWKQALEWVLSRQTVGRYEIANFLEGRTPRGLPINSDAWPVRTVVGDGDWYRIQEALGDLPERLRIGDR